MLLVFSSHTFFPVLKNGYRRQMRKVNDKLLGDDC
jgi:hypothetical protein